MNKYISSYKRKRTEEVSELVAYYKQQRSFTNRNQPSTSSLSSLNPLSISPWDYGLDSNISIKTEKDLAVDKTDFDLQVEPEQQGSNITPKDFMDWCAMEQTKTGGQNAVSFASMMTDTNSYEEQYLSLKIFLAACNTSYKRELAVLLFPVFVHFYLDLIGKPELAAGQAFYTKFFHDHEEQHKEKTTNLQKVTSSNQLILYPSLKELRNHKTCIRLSPHVYLYFLQHLRHGNFPLILQTLNTHFNIRTSTPHTSNKHVETFESIDDEEDNGFDSLSSCTPEEETRISELQKSINAFQMAPNLLKPSICVYSFVNTYHGLTCASFSSNDSMLAGGFEDSSVRFWNIVSKDSLQELASGDAKQTEGLDRDCQILRGHSGIVYQVKYMMDDAFLISASQDKSVRLWNVASSKCLCEYRGHDYPVWSVTASSHSQYFASASMDRTIRLWNVEYAYPLRIFCGHNDSVDSITFHPNGNYIASGSSDRTCRLWDLQSGQFVRVLVGHKSPIRCLTFSKDGKYLLSAGDDSNIIIWDLSNGQILNEINAHTKTIYSLAFSSDGTMLASGGMDKTVKVWESESLFKKSGSSLLKSRHTTIGSYSAGLNSVMNLKFSLGNLLHVAGVSETR